jgi:hypothetical protein
MHLIAPDILADARGLSPFPCGIGVVLGGLVWLCGWRWHRFWVVVAVTVIGGLIGLQTGKSTGGHILAMGVLLGLSAGLLALELARVLAFLAAGTAVWLAAGALFPKGQELWIGFLIGGLLGVLLYRFWTMMLTSFAGVVLAAHALCALAESLFRVDAVKFATEHALILNGAVLAATCMGVAAQSLLERWRLRRRERREKAAEKKLLEKEREKEREKVLASVSKQSLWDRLLGKKTAA